MVKKDDLATIRAAALKLALDGDLAAAADLKRLVDAVEQDRAQSGDQTTE
jgi:hypothetical protein